MYNLINFLLNNYCSKPFKYKKVKIFNLTFIWSAVVAILVFQSTYKNSNILKDYQLIIKIQFVFTMAVPEKKADFTFSHRIHC